MVFGSAAGEVMSQFTELEELEAFCCQLVNLLINYFDPGFLNVLQLVPALKKSGTKLERPDKKEYSNP